MANSSEKPKTKNKLVYLLCIFVIGFVAVFDVYASVMYPGFICNNEQNPIAFNLIRGFGLYNFILIKSVFTFVVLILCWLLIRTKYRSAIVVVAIFQVCLFLYLNFYSKSGELKDHPSPFKILIDSNLKIDRLDIDEEKFFLKRENYDY